MDQTTSPELTEKVLLCDAEGRLNPEAVGWSRRPLHVCNLKGRWPRKKRWDYWCITSERFFFSATIACVDYLSLGSVYLLDGNTRRLVEQTVIRPLVEAPEMPDTVCGEIRLQLKGLALAFSSEESGVRITATAEDCTGKRLSADLEITRPPGHETLNVVVPWNARTFQFTSKQHDLPTRGTIIWGDESFTCEPDTAFACLDFGRGIWPYRTTWNWAAFSGRAGQDVVGVNMGAKWTDGTGANENGIVLNGTLYKLFEDVRFDYDRSDFMKPWHMRTASSDSVDLTFTPFFDRASRTNLLVLRSEVHQMFGRYTGHLRAGGRTVRVSDVPGWAEEHVARW
ncbi:MAG: DUF2804 domain-containing protein [Phycisphaerae bacterium]|nr:DUF2804 domain-containing protein [Phycisphaerae bacterium]